MQIFKLQNSNQVITLFVLKAIFGLLVFVAIKNILPNDFVAASDIVAYAECSQRGTSILYTYLLCHFGIAQVQDIYNPLFVISAIIISSALACGYFLLLEKNITDKGKILFLIILIFHPYLAIYSSRFFSDLFGSIGIFLCFYYIYRNKNIDFFFLICSFMLMHLRSQLIPVFFGLAFFLILRNILERKFNFFNILLFASSFFSLIFYSGYVNQFSSIDYPLFWNILSLMSLREKFALEGYPEIFLYLDTFKIIQLIAMAFLLFFHCFGIYGIFRFSKKYNPLILVLGLYSISSLFGVSHMRYLLPIIPIIIFGFLYIFYKREYSKL